MTPRARAACAWLLSTVSDISPAGLGYWDEVWRLVAPPSTRFSAAVDRLDAEPSETHARDAHVIALDVIRAWRDAADRWRMAGQPRTLQP